MTEEERRRRLRLLQLQAQARGNQSQGQSPAQPQPQRNDDGTYGQPPEGYFLNPETGQMTSRALMTNAIRRGVMDTRADGAGAGLMRGLGQGLTFGAMDEVVGAARALTKDAGGTFSERRHAETERQRALLDASRADHPVATHGGEIAGGVATGAAAGAGAVARAPTLAGRVRSGAFVGAGEGAVYGFNAADSGMDNRAQGAMTGAGVGAVAGGAAPAFMSALRAGGSAVGAPVMSALNLGNESRAANAVVRALEASDTPDIAAALRQAADEGQPEFVLADALGDPGQRALSGAARQPGPGRTYATDFLEQRQLDAADRLSGFVSDGFGVQGTARQVTDNLTEARGRAADVAYSAARDGAGPVDVRGAVQSIDDRIGPMQGSGVSGDGIDATLSRFRDRLTASTTPDGVSSVELSDFNRVLGVKQDLQDAIGAAQRAGRNNEARILTGLANQLDEALEASSPGYRQANDGFREASGVIDAVREGVEANRPSARAADVADRFATLTPEQQSAFRTGYGDRLLGAVENARAGANAAAPLRSTRQQENISLMADDPNRLLRQVDRENTMAETRRLATGGSQTATNLSDQAMANGEDVGIVANLLGGRVGTAGGQVIGRALNAAQGLNEGTRAELVKLLLSRNPEMVEQILQGVARRSSSDAVTEALLRGGGRTSGLLAFSPN